MRNVTENLFYCVVRSGGGAWLSKVHPLRVWVYGALGDPLQGQAGRAVDSGPLIFLQRGGTRRLAVGFVTGCVGQKAGSAVCSQM